MKLRKTRGAVAATAVAGATLTAMAVAVAALAVAPAAQATTAATAAPSTGQTVVDLGAAPLRPTSVDTPTSDPSEYPTETPTPEPSETPTPTPTPTPSPTQSPPPKGPAVNPAPVPPQCARGTDTQPLTAARWAKEAKPGNLTFTDARVSCYLALAQYQSEIFAEVRNAGSLARAAAVLGYTGTAKRRILDRELLASWLNWAHGVYNVNSVLTGKTTFGSAIKLAERNRANRAVPAAELLKNAKFLRTYVNTPKTGR
ncbi:hypothetical protein [Rhizohabitans arisaemae]|uniref:hypothetical protein n=1 Tax=Rhizohabitans arisaemae TaxID=2720610 RepID=UPI0024B17DE8|nr:hypothetical protein [Rhizohabitans arisaemae]